MLNCILISMLRDTHEPQLATVPHESSSPKYYDKLRITVVYHLHVECIAKLSETFIRKFDHLRKVLQATTSMTIWSNTSTGFSNHIDNLPTVFSEKGVGLQNALK